MASPIINPRLADLRRAVDEGKARQLSFLPESSVVRRVVVKPARGVHVQDSTKGGVA